jgi:predicted metal-dependent phosphoesterase TrpH
MSKFEIHMHSTFSDGEFSPTELVQIAKENGVSDLSLTDHDTFEGVDEFLSAAEGTGIHAFPGIEITTRFRDFNLHLLAYFKNMESIDPELKRLVLTLSAKREKRMRDLVDRINQVVPAQHRGKIKFENVRKAAEGVLARPHLAREMVRLKIVPSTGRAFEKYLVEYNVERKNLEIDQVIGLVRKSGGIPILAHPGERTYSLYNPKKGRDYSAVPEQIEELKSYGLLGMECVYPYHEKIKKVAYYSRLARERGLIVTGSRDFHGYNSFQPPSVLGTTQMDAGFLDQFKEVWG